MKKKLILSYDYELFFGDKSGTVLKSVVEPANKLMNIMEKYGFKGTFFVDYLMFRELEKQTEEHALADLKLLKDQIHDMVCRGHRIELHLHPHWIDAKYNGDGTWDFSNFTHYSLSSLDEDTIVGMFKEGTAYLNGIAREVAPDYAICAFRAGGWAVQPFEKLKKGFTESDISVDSSTSYGMFSFQKDSYFDFRTMPKKQTYRFDNDVCIEINKGQFVEVPITSYKQNILLKVLDVLFPAHGERLTDGSHARKANVSESITQKKPLLKRLFTQKRYMLSFSQFSPMVILIAMIFNKDKVICAIDHPKDFSLSTEKGIRNMARICSSYSFKDLIYD